MGTRGWMAVAVVLVGAAPLARGGEARIVEQPNLGGFVDLQAAVDAADDGDTILIAEGEYAGFVIAQKSLSVIGAPTGIVQIQGTVEVANLPASGTVLLAGLRGEGQMQLTVSDPGLRLVGNLGHVRIQSCQFTGGMGVPDYYYSGEGGAGAELDANPRVAFSDTVLTGGEGGGECCQSYSCTGGDGGPGLASINSAIALYDVQAIGGVGGECGQYGGRGGNGVTMTGWGLFASGSIFRGGNGGLAWDFLFACGGSGGDGLRINSAQAQLLDNIFLAGGPGDSLAYCNTPPSAGEQITGNGTINQIAGDARTLRAPVVSSDAAVVTATVTGNPGDRVSLVLARKPAFFFQGSVSGTWLAFHAGLLALSPSGTIPGSGILQLDIPLPDIVGGDPTQLLFMQGYVVDTQGTPVLASPLHVAVLDRAAAPDCNGNGALDLLDVIEGTSSDCQSNLAPDDCDIDSGTSADCNGNDVPDECDIASGTSLDLNDNGIPDECETQMTWWVDASAPPGGDGSQASPFRTIGAGIGAALPGDTVLVADGLYGGANNRDLTFEGKELNVRSVNGPANCIIDCSLQGDGFDFDFSQESHLAVVSGFTILNAKTGISARNSDVSIRNMIVRDAQFRGIYTWSSSSQIRNCIIENCGDTGLRIDSAGSRATNCLIRGNGNAGVLLTGGSRVSHSIIIENTSNSYAGGIRVLGKVTIDNCLIAGNVSQSDGGGLGVGGATNLVNCTVVDNHSNGLGGGAWIGFSGNLMVENSVFWNNSASGGGQELALDDGSANKLNATYSDILGGQGGVVVGSGAQITWGPGNINQDPLFVDPDGPDNDPTTYDDNDYRLSPFSPCTDAADNTLMPPDTFDVDGDGNTSEPVPLDLDYLTRFVDDPAVADTGNGAPPIVDMGTYERQN